VIQVNDGEAASVDGDAGRDFELVREGGGVNSEFAAGRSDFKACDCSEVFDDAGEHDKEVYSLQVKAESGSGDTLMRRYEEQSRRVNLTKI